MSDRITSEIHGVPYGAIGSPLRGPPTPDLSACREPDMITDLVMVGGRARQPASGSARRNVMLLLAAIELLRNRGGRKPPESATWRAVIYSQ